MRKRSSWRTVGAAVAGALLALAGPPAAGAAACTPATNIEAIVDDSFSMQTSDPDKLRVRGLDLLIDALPGSTILGAIQFGSGSSLAGLSPPTPVYPPGPVYPSGDSMKAALDAQIDGKEGTTDFNAAFALADSENPAARARILLTDGGHHEGAYADGHLVHRAPTYVIGLGAGPRGVEGQGRLERIAAETGGHYYSLSAAGQLPAVMKAVGAALTCRTAAPGFTDRLAIGQAQWHGVAIGPATRSVHLLLTWASPRDRFALGGLRLLRRGNTVAVAAGPAQRRRLRLERHGGRTFSIVAVTGLAKGTLRFRVRATRLGSGKPRATLTTFVTRLRTR